MAASQEVRPQVTADGTDLQSDLAMAGASADCAPTLHQWQQFLRSASRVYAQAAEERSAIERLTVKTSDEVRRLTARVSAERDRMHRIFRAMSVGICQVELDGRVAEVNPAFEDILGYARNTLVGRPLAALLDDDEKRRLDEKLERFRMGAIETTTGQRRYRRCDGELVVVNEGITLVRDEDRRPLCLIAVFEDVTERNRLEVELRHAQKLESVGRLASGIAHEINTPIQFVGDNTAFLQTAFEDVFRLLDEYDAVLTAASERPLSLDERARLESARATADLDYLKQNVPHAIASTIDGARRVATIVHAMKSFAHPDKGQKSNADLNAALRSTLTVATNELKYVANVKLELGDIPPVSCYLSDLNQVFLNLMVNAAHAIADVVGKRGDKGTIGVRTWRESSEVVVAISDTGTGIPSEIRHRIFEPFFTTKEVGRGTGQGLALARSVIVDGHGGSLTFQTELGKGTTFFIRLPIEAADAPQRA